MGDAKGLALVLACGLVFLSLMILRVILRVTLTPADILLVIGADILLSAIIAEWMERPRQYNRP